MAGQRVNIAQILSIWGSLEHTDGERQTQHLTCGQTLGCYRCHSWSACSYCCSCGFCCPLLAEVAVGLQADARMSPLALRRKSVFLPLKKVKKPSSNFSLLHIYGTLEKCLAKKVIKETSVSIQEECKWKELVLVSSQSIQWVAVCINKPDLSDVWGQVIKKTLQ